MISLATWLLAARAAQAAIPWAETPELTSCAAGESRCLIRSSWEIARQDRNQVRPQDASLNAPTSWDRSLLGRRFSLLEAWEPASGLGFLMGNELGDQVLQEVPHGTSRENRNPASCLRLASPQALPWRVFARLEQVDHFSDARLSRRSALLGSPDLGSPWPDRRYAWFGENLPPFSLAGAGIEGRVREAEVGARHQQGWIWQHLPLTDTLIPWETRQTDLHAGWRFLRWEHLQRDLDEARAGTMTDRLSTGRIGFRPTGSDGNEAGLTYRLEEARGRSTASETRWTPWIRHRLEQGSWRWSGFHRADRRDHLAQDTLSWSDSTPRARWSLGWAGQWSDAPDNFQPNLEEALTGRLHSITSTEEQVHSLFAEAHGTSDAWDVDLQTRPWIVVSPRATATAPVAPEPHQAVIALPDPLFGWRNHLAVRWKPHTSWGGDLSLLAAPQWGPSDTDVDWTPSVLASHLGAWARSPLGLSMRLQVGWSSSQTVRHLTPAPHRIPATWTVNGWIEQTFFQGRLTLALAALDLGAPNRPDLPDGGQRRPRLLVSGEWQL